MRYSTVSLQSLQRKSDGKGSIKEEDLPTVNRSGTPNLSQTPSQHQRRWQALGMLWYFSLSVWVTCPFHHLPVKDSSTSPSCLLFFLLKEGAEERDWGWWQNTAGTYFKLWRSRSACSVWSESPSCDLWTLRALKLHLMFTVGWTVTFASIQMNLKFMHSFKKYE